MLWHSIKDWIEHQIIKNILLIVVKQIAKLILDLLSAFIVRLIKFVFYLALFMYNIHKALTAKDGKEKSKRYGKATGVVIRLLIDSFTKNMIRKIK